MKIDKDILRRYYIGETSTNEERILHKAYREGKLADDPVLSFCDTECELPDGLMDNISLQISGQRHSRRRRLYLTAAGIAATLILVITIRGFLPHRANCIQLSDNMKIEKFEEVFRVIGDVLEEKTTSNEKVLYEDKNIIITIE